MAFVGGSEFCGELGNALDAKQTHKMVNEYKLVLQVSIEAPRYSEYQMLRDHNTGRHSEAMSKS